MGEVWLVRLLTGIRISVPVYCSNDPVRSDGWCFCSKGLLAQGCDGEFQGWTNESGECKRHGGGQES